VEASLSEKGGMTLALNPSGTREAKSIVSTITCGAKIDLRILVCAEVNTTVDVIADHIHSAFRSSKLPIDGVYRARRKASELFLGDNEAGRVNVSATIMLRNGVTAAMWRL
jgi:hypothetical protein